MNYPGRVIKKGEKDKEIVRAIQKQLIVKGITKLVVDGIFGNALFSAIKLFQARNQDSLGNALICDGVVGPITWEAIFRDQIIIPPISLKPLNQAVINFANSQIGITEDPMFSNSGYYVDLYLNSVNLSPGYPWCMAFVYYCFNEVSKNNEFTNPLVKTGGCLDQWNRCQLPKLNKLAAINDPNLIVPGSVFIMDFGGGKGHTGIVEAVNNGIITSIEGNTSFDKGREGVGVFKNSRKINSITKGFILV